MKFLKSPYTPAFLFAAFLFFFWPDLISAPSNIAVFAAFLIPILLIIWIYKAVKAKYDCSSCQK